MTYSLTPEIASLGKNQLAKKTGWLTVYHADETTREYTGASYEFIIKDTGLPAHSYIDAPVQPVMGEAIVRSTDRTKWEHVPDHRGEVVFDTRTREQFTMSELGDYPTHITPQHPITEFDVWDGEKWVTDTLLLQQENLARHSRQKNALLETATRRIDMLSDRINLEMTNDPAATRAQLDAWRAFRIQLEDTDPVSDTWPPQPE